MQPPLSRHRIFNLLNIVVALSFAGALFYAWTALASQQSLASESAQESRTNTPDSENKPHDEAAEFAERNSNDSLSISWTPKVSPTRTSLLASSSARSSSTPTHSGTAGHKYEPEYYMQYKSPDVEPKKSGASRTCLPTDLSPSSGLVNGKWTLSGLVGGELSRNESNFPQFQYSSNGCEIRRVGVEEARSCLRNKHIVLLGDSLTRQLFGSLIIFLETGKPGLRYKDKHDPAMPGWLESAQDSSEAALGCGSSFLRCDGNGPFFNKPENGEESNRYYINPKHNLKVTFLGYYAAGCGREPVGYAPSSVKTSPEYSWAGAAVPEMAGVIKKYFGLVDVLLFSSTYWSCRNLIPEWKKNVHFRNGNLSLARLELQALESTLKPGGVKIWATTPVHIPNPPYNDGNCAHITFGNGFQAAYTLGWRMLDRYGITAALKTSLEGMGISFQAAAMRDETHAWPFVQNEITNVLLNELCPYPTNSCRTNKPVPGRA